MKPDYSASAFLALALAFALGFFGLRRFGFFFVRHQRFLGDNDVGDADLAEQLVDDLFFEDRGAQAGDGIGIVLEEVIDLLFLARVAADLIIQGALQFLLGNFNAGFLADFGENKTKAHAALGQLAVIFLGRLFRRFLVGE